MVGLNEELGGLDVNNLDRDRRRLGLEYEALTKEASFFSTSICPFVYNLEYIIFLIAEK